MATTLMVFFSMLASCIFGVGAVWLAHEGQDGWGWFIFASSWFIFASIVLGSIKLTRKVSSE
jgi:hypothetical protein